MITPLLSTALSASFLLGFCLLLMFRPKRKPKQTYTDSMSSEASEPGRDYINQDPDLK